MRTTRIALLTVGAALLSVTVAQAATESSDGQSLDTQSPDTQALFHRVWGANGAARWIEEHVDQLALLQLTPTRMAVPVLARAAPVLIIMNDKDQYAPSTLVVPRGTTITWRNDDTDAHTISADPVKSMPGIKMVLPDGAQPWDSGLVDAGKTFTHTFDTAGHYIYICTVHAGHGMVATIDVAN